MVVKFVYGMDTKFFKGRFEPLIIRCCINIQKARIYQFGNVIMIAIIETNELSIQFFHTFSQMNQGGICQVND